MRRIFAGILRHDLGGEAERLGVERRVALGLGAQRVQAGGEVAVGAVGLDERRGGLDGLQDLLVRRRGGGRLGRLGRGGRGDLGRRAGGRHGRGGREAEIGEDALVELVLAVEERLDHLQEAAGLGALDDAVVVGGGHRHDLLGAEPRRRPPRAPAGSRSRRWR